MNDLNFQSFGNDFSVNTTNEQSGFTGGTLGDRDRNTLVDDNVSTSGTKRNFFSVSYYQQFFDVDTEMVVKRILNSVVPTNNNFILDFVQPLPDLWGPFWISLTLIFSIGIFGNIAQYIGNEGGEGSYGSDFRLVTSASIIIFLYVVFVPMLLFGILWHRKSDLQYPYLDIVCAYGYSLTIFIPVSLLWILNVNWLRWVLILTSVTLSGSVLAKAIYPAFKNDSNRLVAFGSVLAVFLLHFLLAFAFKEFFFDPIHPLKEIGSAASQTIANISGPTANGNFTPTLPSSALTTPISNMTSNQIAKFTSTPAVQTSSSLPSTSTNNSKVLTNETTSTLVPKPTESSNVTTSTGAALLLSSPTTKAP